MAMRSVAKITVNLGLFGIPVNVYLATEKPTAGLKFRQLHKVCCHPINEVRVCRHCEASEDPTVQFQSREISMADLLKGYEVEPDRFLTFTDEEIKSAKPESGGDCRVTGYIDQTTIDATYFDGAVYFLTPDRGERKKADQTAFVTFREALNGRYAIGSVVMYGRDHIVAIRAYDKVLAMHFLRTHAEVRKVMDIPRYDDIPTGAPADCLGMMTQVMDAHGIGFGDVALEKDSYVSAMEAMIDAKKTGQPVSPAATEASVPTAFNLQAMLQASLEAGKAA